MSALFLKLLNMSMAAGWLVMAVIVVRLCLKKAPKSIHCALWALVAIRLICPVSPESSLSLIPEAVADGSVVAEWADNYMDDIDIHHPSSVYYDAAIGAGREPISDGEGGYYVVTKHDQLGEPDTIENTVIPILSWVWLAGAAALLLYAAVSFLRIRARVRVSLHWAENIWRSEQVDSPFILGILHPNIYLPFGMDEAQMRHVIAHEQAHLRRRDHWWKPLGFLLLAVYWFHPLMWAAYILLCRDIELACDERVIRDMAAPEKRAYSEALLACSVPRRMVAACPLAFGEVGVKKRIASVLHYKKPAFWLLLAALAASAAVAVCFLTDPPGEAGELPQWFDTDELLLAHILEHVEADGEPLVHGTYLETSVEGGGSGYKKYRAYTADGTEYEVTAYGRFFRQALVTGPYGPGLRVTDIVCAPVGSADDAGGPPVLWTYSPMLSATWHAAFHFNFDLSCTHIEAACDNGMLVNLHAAEQPRGKALRFAANEPLCWSPDLEDALTDTTETAAVDFTVYDGKTVLYAGTLHLVRTGTENGRSFYQASLSGTSLLSLQQADGNMGGTLIATEPAVWFTPEDIHDIESMELVWHDGQRFTPLTEEGTDYIQARLGSAREIDATGCPYHSVLFLHRADGVVGKVLPAEDSCDTFLSGGKYYQFGDRANPPYSDSNETFYNHFGTSPNDLPHYGSVPHATKPGTVERSDFANLLGCSGYMTSDGGSPWEMRTYYAVAEGQEWPIAETFGFEGPQDYLADLDGDGVLELIANVQFGGDGARRAYVYQRRGDEIYLGTLSAEGLPNFEDWGANAIWSEYEPSTGIFRLHYAQKGREDYGVFETTGLERFQFDAFRPAPPREAEAPEPAVTELVPVRQDRDTLDAVEWTVSNSLNRQYLTYIPNTQTLTPLLVEADPAESARAALQYFQRTDDLAVKDPVQAANLVAVKAVYHVDWFLDTASNAADAGTHAAYYYLIPHGTVEGRWGIHDIVPTAVPEGLALPQEPSDDCIPIPLKACGASEAAAAAQLNVRPLCTTDEPAISSIYQRSDDPLALFLITGDGLAGELPVPDTGGDPKGADLKASHLDLNYHIYYYEITVPEPVLAAGSRKVLTEAGTYRYFVDMEAAQALRVFVPEAASVEAPARTGGKSAGGSAG